MHKTTHVGHGNKKIAYHIEWAFRKEALRWIDDRPIGPNFHPIAGELRQWLLREGPFSIFAEEHKGDTLSYTNPYTYDASALVSILADVTNDSYSIATNADLVDPTDAEIARVRNYNEQVLYIARVCEALTKQLLFCTQIPRRNYDKASLGTLLSTECRGCRSAGQRRHKLSLLGSLAHRYGLCGKFEQCLGEHMKIVARRRNLNAAHSNTPTLNIRSAVESRDQLKTDTLELGNEFIHMLEHLNEIETHMFRELERAVQSHFLDSLAKTRVRA